MWDSIPVDVGQHSGEVGQPETAPRVAASGPGWMGLLPLLFHPLHLPAERLAVAFWYRRFVHFLDDVGEVLQAGDRGSGSGVEHGDVLAGASQQDGPLDLFHGDASPVHVERQLFIGS